MVFLNKEHPSNPHHYYVSEKFYNLVGCKMDFKTLNSTINGTQIHTKPNTNYPLLEGDKYMILSFTEHTANRADAIYSFGAEQIHSNTVINPAALRAPRKLSSEIIAPAAEQYYNEVATDHASEPIKSLDDIYRISEYLVKNKRYRDNMLFIVGINFGLRCSDLRVLRFGDIITENFMFKETFPVFEKKTRNTRKRKKNRYITVNDAVVEAVTLYLENTPGVTLSDYMFRSESNRGGNQNEPLTIQSINWLLKGIAKDLDLNVKISSHTLRKTFCYWMMVQGQNDQRRLLLLQKILNHSTPAQTLQYIGITDTEIAEAYKALNIGSKKYVNLINSNIVEFDDEVAAERSMIVG